jgi:hypothetical protein
MSEDYVYKVVGWIKFFDRFFRVLGILAAVTFSIVALFGLLFLIHIVFQFGI